MKISLQTVILLIFACFGAGCWDQSPKKTFNSRTPQEIDQEQAILDSWLEDACTHAAKMNDSQTSVADIASAALELSKGHKDRYMLYLAKYFKTQEGRHYLANLRERKLHAVIVSSLCQFRTEMRARQKALDNKSKAPH